MELTQSAFKPVSQKGLYEVVTGFDKIQINVTEKSVFKPVLNKRRVHKKKKWSLEDKKRAVIAAKALGISHAIDYLCGINATIFSCLSPSTLQYWIIQSKSSENVLAKVQNM